MWFDLVGMGVEEVGGIGEVGNFVLFVFCVCYCFFFNLICYISLGLVVVEVMMIGMLIVGLVIMEMSIVICNGDNGYVDISFDVLVGVM